MELILKPLAEEHLRYFSRTGNAPLKNKIQKLLDELERHPYFGTGQPERLKPELFGYWSRRINREHRIIYQINDEANTVTVFSLKGHYEKKS